jgi:hypothetical protein
MDEMRRFVGIDVAKAALDVFIGSTGTALPWNSATSLLQISFIARIRSRVTFQRSLNSIP